MSRGPASRRWSRPRSRTLTDAAGAARRLRPADDSPAARPVPRHRRAAGIAALLTDVDAVSGRRVRGGVRRAAHRADRAGRRGPALGRCGLGRGAAVPRAPRRGHAAACWWSPTATTRSGPQHSARPLLGDFAALDGAHHAAAATALASTGSRSCSTATALRRRRGARADRRQPVLRRRGRQGPRPPAAGVGARRRAGPDRRRRTRRLRGAPAGRGRPGPARRPGAAGARRRPADPAAAARRPACCCATAAAWSSGTSWPGWRWRAPSRPAGPRGCTPGCSTPSSRSSRATWPCSPTTPSPPATRAAARQLRRGGRPGGRSDAGSHTEAVAFLRDGPGAPRRRTPRASARRC